MIQWINFSRGLQPTVNPLLVENNAAGDSCNFVYHLGKQITRGGVFISWNGPTNPSQLHRHITTADVELIMVSTELYSAGTPKLYKTAPATLTEITGAGFTETANVRRDMFSFGGLVYKLTASGLVVADVSANTYTVTAGIDYRYATPHLDRALYGYNSTYPQRVGWSITGDPTNVAGAGSGTADLVNMIGSVKGIATLREYAIILGTNDLWLGIPTGNATAPYNFKRVLKFFGDAVPFTLAAHNDIIYWRSGNIVYRFNLDKMELLFRQLVAPIGQETTGASKGIVARISPSEADYYILGNVTGGVQNAYFYAYNIDEDTYEQHRLTDTTTYVVDYTTYLGLPAYTDYTGIKVLAGSFNAQTSYIESKQINFEFGHDSDVEVSRILFTGTVYGGVSTTFTITGELNGVPVTANTTVTLGVSGTNALRDVRQWVPLRISGNNFKIKLSVGANSIVYINALGIDYAIMGETRGK